MSKPFTRFSLLSLLPLVATLMSCGTFQSQADAKFGDQHFKTTIALIELHKVRYGEYPASLSDLTFTGDWDQIAIKSVAYARVDSGYTLEVTRGWVGKPALDYPPEFWKGLGLRQPDSSTHASAPPP